MSMSKVLVVDDDEEFRTSTARTLEAHGYACVEAANTADARVVIDDEQDVEAVLCDIRMPGPSGLELLTELTTDAPDLAVVMTTAVDDPRVAEAALEAGAFGYLTKPIEVNELLINLTSALRRRDLEVSRRGHVRALEHTISRTKILDRVIEGIEEVEEAGDDAQPGSATGDLIDRLSRAVSLRDEETGRHLERMSRYSVVLARAVGWSTRSLDDLRLATALHDVGKIGIPDGILLKPGPLTAGEIVAMHRHSEIGHQLLTGSASPVLRLAAEIALTHHEWWDGNGYPRGLHGTEIPEEARIASVADVFDALTSHRVYRPALTFDAALALMDGLRGRQFEPRLLDAFVSSLHEIAEIRRAFDDRPDLENRVRVLVVDDHPIFTHSLIRLLETKPGVKVVGSAGTVASAAVAAVAYAPDVILMDFELPDGDGPEATRQIKALMPSVKIVMLTARTDEQALVAAIAAGCAGFVTKTDTIDALLDAVMAAHEGETVAPTHQLEPLLRQLRPTRRGLGADLTPREFEVLDLMAAGLVNKQIAARLGLRLNTIRNHVQNVLLKLAAHSKLEAVATAVREGIVNYPAEAVGH